MTATSGRPAASSFAVVTPCLNAEPYIAETMRSVVRNSVFRDPGVRLHYQIRDGGSRDATLEIAREVAAESRRANIEIELHSEPDGGMYDALAKGLAAARGDICAYLNAGDYYAPTAFEVVREVFATGSVRWLTGLRVRYNEQSHLVSARLPTRFRRRLCEAGLYGRLLPCIQQESTFWSGELNRQVDYAALARFRLAGDYYLWRTFAASERLFTVHAWLGGFKVHANQLSRNMDAYLAELRGATRAPTPLDWALGCFDWACARMPDWFIRLVSGDSLFVFDFREGRYVRQGRRPRG